MQSSAPARARGLAARAAAAARASACLRGDAIVLYAITIEPLNTIVFAAERPEDNPWEVHEGVALDAAPLYGTWTADRGSLEEISSEPATT